MNARSAHVTHSTGTWVRATFAGRGGEVSPHDLLILWTRRCKSTATGKADMPTRVCD
ncbi:hypothetical protein TI01_1365 [Lysobacter sp. A03]|nr:hypothetical protein TI01_1365 [Lysobacter sp. A03]